MLNVRRVRKWLVLCGVIAGATMLAGALPSTARSYGGGADHDVYQIGFSINCVGQTDPTHCPGGLGAHGGKWGWLEFDHWADPTGGPNGTGTDGDGDVSVCIHGVDNPPPGAPPGGASAFHEKVDIHKWHIGFGPVGFTFQPVFYLDDYDETFMGGPLYGNTPVTEHFGPNANFASGFPSTPGHYTAADLGFPDVPGLSINIQVSLRPAQTG